MHLPQTLAIQGLMPKQADVAPLCPDLPLQGDELCKFIKVLKQRLNTCVC